MTYFTIAEMTRSDTARQLNIPNNPTPEQTENLQYLIEDLLDMVRQDWGRPIRVTSGFRSAKLNQQVGGVLTSQHTKGEAADITTGSKIANKNLFDMIERGGYVFDQLIWEKGDSTGPDWIHISYRKGGNRKQIVRIP